MPSGTNETEEENVIAAASKNAAGRTRTKKHQGATVSRETRRFEEKYTEQKSLTWMSCPKIRIERKNVERREN